MKLPIKSLSALALILGVLVSGCVGQGAGTTTDSPRNRLQIAEAMFQERCKTAGEKIYRTVDNVEGIFIIKVRPTLQNFSNQFEMDDPYGRDLGGDGYILTFLRGSYQAQTTGVPNLGSPPRIGYRYVEAIDPQNGMRYRYTGSMKATRRKDPSAPNVQIELKRDPNYDLNIYDFVLDRVPASTPSPRYGVTYDDISTHKEREYWIAGSSLKVIDLQTNEVIAERIGYMMDQGQGNTSGGRSPWLLAANRACPSFAPRHGAAAQAYQALDLVEKTLKPKLEN